MTQPQAAAPVVKSPAFWAVVACGCAILIFSTGLRQTLGLFLRPMTIELGLGREIFAFAVALSNLLWGAAGPFAGAIADKWGTGRTLAVGALLYAGGLWAMAEATDGTLIVLGNVLIGLAMGGVGFGVILGAVGRAARPEQRSVALGIVTAGGSFGQFALVPYGQVFLDWLGWPLALLVLAISALVILPFARGLAGLQASAAAQSQQSLGAALREALQHRGFWLLTIGFFVCGFQVVFVAVHLPAFVADHGLAG